jgi:hypothetical protein
LCLLAGAWSTLIGWCHMVAALANFEKKIVYNMWRQVTKKV